MNVLAHQEIPFEPDWPAPDDRLLRAEMAAAPELPLCDVLGPRLAAWVNDAAKAKGAPADFVFAALLAVAGATIGNARWVSPWRGWTEPPIIWAACIGLPSAGKSPAIDAVLAPLLRAERPMRERANAELAAWEESAEVAKLVESVWKESVKAAIKEGKTPPAKPVGATLAAKPHIPRLVVNDGTIEKLGAIVARQPRGLLQTRDELAGWLEGMQRYSGGGSDRPFWLEAYGGRGFTVERMGREPLTIDRLAIGVVGGIQPDRLRSLLFKADDDGLLARFLPIWPEPAPLNRPSAWGDDALIDAALARLLSLDLVTEANGETHPSFLQFTEGARDRMDDFRRAVREWEAGAEGLLLSFIGKLPGLVARLSLVLAVLDWAADEADEPREITVEHFGRAAQLAEMYLLPMARRAYAEASDSKPLRAARRLVEIIREAEWQQFTSRDVLRLDRQGLGAAAELNPALTMLEDGDCIRPVEPPPAPRGGRPQRLFLVNPAIHAERK
ncbi:YfjI family protein [Defluviimonas sp. WL0024]|uniref:YfjI family protein n=1 Tax=Albidovulum salinarum TaxID=2984153 RepID=A0ABT2WYF9_9RHOB|nr:YfjI family protein [Defluviimonas sp. WL0024]MCU9846718.1 YfjI family protein [Defluviimonas sp. WL0024]